MAVDVLPSTSTSLTSPANSTAFSMNGHTRALQNGHPMVPSSPLSPCRTLEGQRYVTLPTIPPISILVPHDPKVSETENQNSAPPSVENLKPPASLSPVKAPTNNITRVPSEMRPPVHLMQNPFQNVPTTSASIPQMVPMLPVPATSASAQPPPQLHAQTPTAIPLNFIQTNMSTSVPSSIPIVMTSQPQPVQQQMQSQPMDHQQSAQSQQNTQLLQMVQQQIMQAQAQQQAQMQQQAQAQAQQQQVQLFSYITQIVSVSARFLTCVIYSAFTSS